MVQLRSKTRRITKTSRKKLFKKNRLAQIRNAHIFDPQDVKQAQDQYNKKQKLQQQQRFRNSKRGKIHQKFKKGKAKMHQKFKKGKQYVSKWLNQKKDKLKQIRQDMKIQQKELSEKYHIDKKYLMDILKSQAIVNKIMYAFKHMYKKKS